MSLKATSKPRSSQDQGGVLLSVHCDTSDEITRAKDLLKHTGAQDISSSGEASAGLPGGQQGRGAPVELVRGRRRRNRRVPVPAIWAVFESPHL